MVDDHLDHVPISFRSYAKKKKIKDDKCRRRNYKSENEEIGKHLHK